MASPVSPILEQLKLRREKGRRLVHKIGILQAVEGAAAVILGVVTLVYGAPNFSYYFYLGTPLWTGLLLLVGGVFGIKASAERDGPGDLITSRQKTYILGNCGTTIINMTPAVFVPVFSGLVVGQCSNVPLPGFIDRCPHVPSTNVTIAQINMIFGAVLCISILPVLLFYCLFARAFGLRKTNISTVSDPVVDEETRCQADIIRQQQEEIHRMAERQNVGSQ